MRSRSARWLAASFLTFALWTGCNGQSEGQVCSPLNGQNADCADNLVCIPRQGLAGYRCCPADPTHSTTAVCGLKPSGLVVDSAAPPFVDDATSDGATVDATLTDAATLTDGATVDSDVADGANDAPLDDEAAADVLAADSGAE